MRERINHMGMDFNTALKISCKYKAFTYLYSIDFCLRLDILLKLV